MPTSPIPRTIKRYENRKLYDLQAKRYVCLRDVAEIIRSGIDVVVIDNATGEDLTPQTLTKVIADGAGRSHGFAPSTCMTSCAGVEIILNTGSTGSVVRSSETELHELSGTK